MPSSLVLSARPSSREVRATKGGTGVLAPLELSDEASQKFLSDILEPPSSSCVETFAPPSGSHPPPRAGADGRPRLAVPFPPPSQWSGHLWWPRLSALRQSGSTGGLKNFYQTFGNPGCWSALVLSATTTASLKIASRGQVDPGCLAGRRTPGSLRCGQNNQVAASHL